jgi:membrane fusion protein (multidrug efflux system)
MVRNLFALALTSFLFGACNNTDKNPQQVMPTLDVQVFPVARQDVPLYTEFVGQTFGLSDVEITSRVEGWVTSMNYKEGGEVKLGQVLYTIDPLPYQNKLDQSRGGLAEARTMLEKARADLSRIEPLADMKAVSQRELVSAKAQYGAAEARVQASQAAVRNAELEVGYTRIKAPISGVIGISKVRVGDYVNPIRSVLNTVSQVSTIRVRFTLAENDLLRLYRLTKEQNNSTVNPNVDMILSDGSVFPQKGTINFTDRQVDPATGALTFDASFPNPDKFLRPGQYVKVRLLTEKRSAAMIVPQRAISEMQGQNQVFVVGDSNKVFMKMIQTGPRFGRFTVVESGLEPGNQVILGGTAMIRNGMKVNPKIVSLADTASLAIPEN